MVFRLHLIHVLNTKVISPGSLLVCYTAVFSVVTQRSSPQRGEERCVFQTIVNFRPIVLFGLGGRDPFN